MHKWAAHSGVATNGYRYLAYAEYVEHIELPGRKLRNITDLLWCQFKREGVRYLMSHSLHTIQFWHHWIAECTGGLVLVHRLRPPARTSYISRSCKRVAWSRSNMMCDTRLTSS